MDIIQLCKPFSMISQERFECNLNSVDHIERNNIPGDIVEIGVWKGGSILSMILKYQQYGKSRLFHLYDTFEGMTPSTIEDKDLYNKDAEVLIEQEPFFLCYASLTEVKANISLSGYPSDKIFYHKGDICKNTVYPEQIALLRLDTDWYESTKFELKNFYPLVSPGGIVIIDDYGHWKGCRKAVDEFLLEHPELTIKETDYTGIYFIKPTQTPI